MTAPLPTDLAMRLMEEWAADRLTVPTPAERDLTRWIVERLDQAWDVAALFRFAEAGTKPGANVEDGPR